VSNISNVIGPSETWEPTNKTISIRTSTWKKLQQYGTYGDSFDTILQRILTKHERQEAADKEERSF
jgi:predicted CopG family antitoxin